MVQSGEAITNVRTGQRMVFRKTGRETNGTLLEIECFNPPSGVKEPEHIHQNRKVFARLFQVSFIFRLMAKCE